MVAPDALAAAHPSRPRRDRGYSARPPTRPCSCRKARSRNARRPRRCSRAECQLYRLGPHGISAIRPAIARPADATDCPVLASLGPCDLLATYNLAADSAADGNGVTVAVVDAWHDPHIVTDLQAYRAQWDLPACANPSGTGTGAGCLTQLNQNGAASPLPAAPSDADTIGWEDETAGDVEMISAICPNCSIDVFEANSDDLGDMGTAENSAARVTDFVSNSWASEDIPGESVTDMKYFNHPGKVIAFASGDYGYGPGYPASSGLVISVGGTYLQDDSAADQTAWNEDGYATASGCSAGEGKPSWQTDPGCATRTENDVSAVADAPSAAAPPVGDLPYPGGIDVYSSSGDCGPSDGDPGAFETKTGDCSFVGTSLATPIITAVYALAGTPGAEHVPGQLPVPERPRGRPGPGDQRQLTAPASRIGCTCATPPTASATATTGRPAGAPRTASRPSSPPLPATSCRPSTRAPTTSPPGRMSACRPSRPTTAGPARPWPTPPAGCRRACRSAPRPA